MNFNQYSFYSMNSSVLDINNNESGKLWHFYEELLKTDSVDEVKEILMRTYSIKDSNKEYVLGVNGFLQIHEDKYLYTINLAFENNNYTYSYRK